VFCNVNIVNNQLLRSSLSLGSAQCYNVQKTRSAHGLIATARYKYVAYTEVGLHYTLWYTSTHRPTNNTFWSFVVSYSQHLWQPGRSGCQWIWQNH